MSYARWSKDSDVYVFCSVDAHLECCGCWLGGERHFRSTEAMLAHLDAHRAAGHMVPEYAYDGLRADAEKNDSFIAASESPVL